MNNINIDKLPKWKNGANKGKVNWAKSIGYAVDFEYDNIIGSFKIVNKNGMRITILYEEQEYILSTDSIINCRLGSLFFKPIWETDRWMVGLGMYEKDAKKYRRYSMKKVIVKCPKCNREKLIAIGNMYRRRSISCMCNFKSIRYPERFISEFLKCAGINFVHQVSKEYLTWCNKYKYDFYIPEHNMIIETHGEQHYRDNTNFKMSLKEVQENDRLKENLAKLNGVKYYIVVDCRMSEFEYIKQNVLSSNIIKILDILNVDWREIANNLLVDLDDEICKYWNNKEEWETAKNISEKMNLSYKIVKRSLEKLSSLGLCDYSPKEEHKKSLFKKGQSTQSKPIEVYKDGLFLGVFESATYIDNNSMSIFGEKLVRNYIRDVCNGKKKMYKNYFFKEVV